MFEKNLKYYRLKKNMTKKDLATAVGVTPMAISNYEAGNRMPEMETINKMANVLGVKVVDFLASRNKSLQFEHREFRKHSALSKAQQDYIRESVEEYFSRFFSAIDCLGGDPLPHPPKCHTIELSGDFRKDAIRLRKHMGLPADGPIEELVGLLENHGVMVVELDIDDEKFSGINGTVNGYPYIVINKNMRAERKRTTILHELAHIMFLWDESKEKENEKTATAIAGAFLITDEDLFRELGQRRHAFTKDMILVCEEYGISSYLLAKRAEQAGIFSEAAERDFYIKANAAGWRHGEPSRVKSPESPFLFRQLVYRAINEEGVSIQRGAELLGVPYGEVEEYCGLAGVSP